MKKMKILGLIIGIIAISATAFACGKKEDVQTYAWPLATASPEDTVTQLYAERFAEEVEQRSGGKMKIQVYPNSTLGGDREMLETCKDGDIPFIVQNTAPQVNFMPDTAIFDMPCIFDNIKQARERVDSEPFYSLMKQVYMEGGYQLLGYADQGFRVMSTNKKVEKIGDFKGQKIRTMENAYHMDFWKALQANPTPMTFSEVYIGLAQHTIDAQENPYEVIVSNRLYEQQEYVVETNHLPHLISLIVSDEFYQELSKKEQEIIHKAGDIAKEYAREQSDIRIVDKVNAIEESGTKIIKMENQLTQEVREKAQPVYKRIEENVSEDVYKAYMLE